MKKLSDEWHRQLEETREWNRLQQEAQLANHLQREMPDITRSEALRVASRIVSRTPQ